MVGKAVGEQPTFAPAIRVLVASNASLDRMDDATKGLARLREINAIARISDLGQFRFKSLGTPRSMLGRCERPDLRIPSPARTAFDGARTRARV